MQTSEVLCGGCDAELWKSAIVDMSHEVIKKTSEVFLLGARLPKSFLLTLGGEASMQTSEVWVNPST